MSNRFIDSRKGGYEAEVAAVAGATAAYEFGPRDNEIFTGVSRAMRIVGFLSILFGVLVAVRGCVSGLNLVGLLEIGQGVALMAIGGWLAGASTSLQEVATTTGSDIANLMIAMRKLRSVYTLQAWLMCIACTFIAITMVMLLRAH